MIFENRKGVSPLVATAILIIFSLILGTVTMNVGKSYIEDMSSKAPVNAEQVKYISGVPYTCISFEQNTNKCLNWKAVE